jgi:hypothetical protein
MPLALNLNPPFRAEHIGSLLRPRELKDAFGAHSRGQLAIARGRRWADDLLAGRVGSVAELAKREGV